MPFVGPKKYRESILLMYPDATAPLTSMLGKLLDKEYVEALDRIRAGSISPDDVHIILTHPSPASGFGDE